MEICAIKEVFLFVGRGHSPASNDCSCYGVLMLVRSDIEYSQEILLCGRVEVIRGRLA